MYTFEYESRSENRVLTSALLREEGSRDGGTGSDALRGDFKLRGALVLASYGLRGDSYLLTARIEDLTHAEARALGQDLLPSLQEARDTFEPHLVELRIKPTGEVLSMRYSQQASRLYCGWMELLLQSFAFELREGESWSHTGRGPAGTGLVQFGRDPEPPFAIRKKRAAYTQLDAWPFDDPPPHTVTGEARLVLDRDGNIEELHERETLVAGDELTSHFSMRAKLTLERAFVGEPPTDLRDAAPGEVGEESKRAELEERTRGFDMEQLIGDLHLFVAAPKEGDLRWAWIADGYLTLHPEECAVLAKRMADLETPVRSAAIDLLASVGTKEAQAALVGAFSDGTIANPAEGPAAAQQRLEYAELLQSLGQIQEPTQETVQFLVTSYQRAKHEHDLPVQAAAAIALSGVLAGVAEPQARSLARVLALDLQNATHVTLRRALIDALGNAATESESIVRYADDEDVHVRVAVANALRKVDGPKERATLLTLLADSESFVQHRAISSLARRQLGAAELGTIRKLVEGGTIERGNYEVLVNLCVSQPLDLAAPLLHALSAREDLDPETRGRIHRVLGEP